MADERQFSVMSSDGTTLYSIIFIREGAAIRVRCNCKAGAMGQMCKHKEGLLLGDAALLADPQETPELREIQAWIAQSELKALLSAISEAEDAAKTAQGRVKQLRQQLTRTISG